MDKVVTSAAVELKPVLPVGPHPSAGCVGGLEQ